MVRPAPASTAVRSPAQLLPALGFVLTGLPGRALIAALLFSLPGPLSLPVIGLAWMLAYAVYAGFNLWALRRVRTMAVQA